MKKFIALFFCLLFLTGCSNNMEDKLIKSFKDDVNSSKSYSVAGTLDITNDEDTFNYTISVAYKKGDYYKTVLTNQVSGHEQIILKNKDGVYLITPSLNKSFKFQSSWPDNSSQSYILSSVLNDLLNTEDKKFSEDADYYILTSNVNYPNNNKLTYQKLYFSKDMQLKKVEVYDNTDTKRVTFNITTIDYKANLDEDYFDLSKSIDSNCCGENTETSNFNDILYPLYIPKDTYLTAKETINTDNGSRAILTFGGAKDFVLVEEASKVNSELEVIPIYGEPLMMNGTFGALSGNAIYWSSNNVDYYLAGSSLSSEELLSVANSVSNSIVTSK
ncbi:MAG: hypothetical protein PUD34_02210 [bacterium]|nr:hypothetical protein [bacterium]